MTDKVTTERSAEESSLQFAEWAWPHTSAEPVLAEVLDYLKFKPNEQRLLWITVVGTFIGGVASIFVAGGALFGIVRIGLQHPPNERDLVSLGILTAFAFAFLLAAVGAVRFAAARRRVFAAIRSQYRPPGFMQLDPVFAGLRDHQI